MSSIPPDLRDRDARLLRVIDQGFASRATRAGEALACRAGCSDCCKGPFPITALDALRLSRAMQSADRTDPARAARIRLRSAAAREALAGAFPGHAAQGRLEADEATLDRYFADHRDRVCPVLDPTTGRCDLYEARPVACRSYGLPLRFHGKDSPPCGFNFVDASPQLVEACRFEPDPDDLESDLLADLGVGPGEEWTTLIAWAVSGGSPW